MGKLKRFNAGFKAVWLLAVSLASATGCLAQGEEHAPDSMRQRYYQLQRHTGRVLGVWGLSNLAAGVIGSSVSDGRARYFHQMNAGWGLVNAALAWAVLRQVKRSAGAAGSITSLMDKKRRTEKILLLNSVLDAGYIAVGAALTAHQQVTPDRLERRTGSGRALMLQGGFLLAFDLVQYVCYRRMDRIPRKTSACTPWLTPNGAGLVYRW